MISSDISENTLKTLSQNSGAVSVAITPTLNNSEYEFNIEFNTHSVELNYDLVAISSLTNEQNQILNPLKWEGDAEGGHHRKGKLIFPKFNNRPKILNLTINEIGEKGVNFEWKL